MSNYYEKNSKLIKSIADPRRLEIIDILSKGEKCACDILDYFQFTQPTLSHHMKILISSGLVESKRIGKYQYYRLNTNNANKLILFLLKLTTDIEEENIDK